MLCLRSAGGSDQPVCHLVRIEVLSTEFFQAERTTRVLQCLAHCEFTMRANCTDFTSFHQSLGNRPKPKIIKGNLPRQSSGDPTSNLELKRASFPKPMQTGRVVERSMPG